MHLRLDQYSRRTSKVKLCLKHAFEMVLICVSEAFMNSLCWLGKGFNVCFAALPFCLQPLVCGWWCVWLHQGYR